MNGPHALRLLMTTALALALFGALMQPRGAGDLGLPAGFLFQALHLLPATGLAWWLSRSLQARLTPARAGSVWPGLALVGALTGVALAPWSVTLEWFFGVAGDAGAAPIESPAGWLRELASELITIPPITAVVWPAMALIVRVASPYEPSCDGTSGLRALREQGPHDPETTRPAAADAPAHPPTGPSADMARASSTDQRPSLTARLPTALGNDVLRIEAQEHYVRIVTPRGSTLLLLGISQAVDAAEAEGIEGVRVHRSHWVALAHIVRIEASAVVASNGENVPLSRRRAARVRAAWRAARGG